MKPISIVIADDHKLVREAWMMVLNDDKRFNVLLTCGTAESAIEAVKKLAPGIVLLDIRLPGISGIEAVPMLLEASPGTKIIGVSIHAVPAYARKMIQLGASGYVTKNSSKEEMFEAILAVDGGNKFICSNIKDLMTEEFTETDGSGEKVKELSRRELEIVDLIRQGLCSREIGEKLAISIKTVEVHRHNIFKKLKLKNVASLINFLSKR